ncbi:MAG: MarR family transcriptional regulator [Spirochaetaceae bacterium]|nr:MarR family transcriptional regulator [Spirochaetaceae bacterium]
MDSKLDCLKLENQLCFPLYAASKEVIRKYRPFLEELDLTYTQYISMMVLWQEKSITVKDLGSRLFLDSGTLTPLLKSLETKGLVTRNRSPRDERILIVSITESGENLKNKATFIPEKMASCINLTKEEAEVLYKILSKILFSNDSET